MDYRNAPRQSVCCRLLFHCSFTGPSRALVTMRRLPARLPLDVRRLTSLGILEDATPASHPGISEQPRIRVPAHITLFCVAADRRAAPPRDEARRVGRRP